MQPYLYEYGLLFQSMAATAQELALRKTGDAFYENADVEFRRNTKVVKVNSDANTLETQGGEIFEYTHLVLASGSNPRTIPIAKDIPNVYLLRTPDDGNKIGMFLIGIFVYEISSRI